MSPIDARAAHRPALLTPAECDRIISASDGLTIPCSEPFAPQRTRTPDGMLGGRLSVCPVDDPDEHLGEDIAARLWHFVAEVDQRAFRWGLTDVFDVGRVGVSRYGPGDHMCPHVDDEERGDPPWDRPHRGISVSVPLSAPDDYQGGQLRLYDAAGAVVPTPRLERGDALAFGSSTPHEVRPVTSGARWVLLFWAYTNHDARGIR